MDKALKIGKITSTHGLAGMLKVYPYTNHSDDIEAYRVMYLDAQLTEKVDVKSVKYHKKFVILQFVQFNHINQVERLKGRFLYVDKEDASDMLDEDEFYVDDLMQMAIVTDSGKALGVVTGYRENKHQVTLEIDHDGYVWFLPFIDQFIIGIDEENNQIQINLIEGLYDEN